MYLKKIIASGFKSFADKTVIELTDGITGVVGPNGSGKSNVVDAVRWVLGEQSIKSLRGDNNMTDVIFSGSKSRKPQNVATVTLVFDNQDHYLKIDFNEVAIRRRVYKDGTNEYSINEEKCRLKDVTDLFLDTGIAKESFNIISQGKVSEIITSKPENRRTIFEEAAGVLKYKKRKEEAIRKLDRTNENLNRVNDIIGELESQIGPLKEDRDKALIFQETNDKLEQLEVAYITEEITDLNEKYQLSKKKMESLNEEIISLSTINSTNSTSIEQGKVKLNEFDQKISNLQLQLIEQIKKVEKINSEKNILLERKQYEVDDIKLHNHLLELKEEGLKLQNDYHKVELEEEQIQKDYSLKKEQKDTLEESLKKIKQSKMNLENKLTTFLRKKVELENKVSNLQNMIENNSLLPSSVTAILSNPKLTGVIDVIGNLIEVGEDYSKCISVALGASASYVVMENEKDIQQSIQYLKQNHLGRATFFPLNIIKSKYVDRDTLSLVAKQDGFIDLASNLVKYDTKYKNIIENQLGNILVVKDMNAANVIGKKINHIYRIVTLDGEMFHVGGSITGGDYVKTRNMISIKYDLENELKEQQKNVENIKEIENNMNEIDYEYRSIEDKLYLNNKEIITVQELLSNKNMLKQNLKEELDKIKSDEKGTNSILNHELSNEEEKILSSYYEAVDSKNKIESDLEIVKKDRTNLYEKLEESEFSLKQENNLVNSKNKEVKDLEIEVNRMDVKLDNLLSKLNETYGLTYEKARYSYHLDMDREDARIQVMELKRVIKDLGMVNLGAIEEFERVNERYEFLHHQKEDLDKAIETLLEIIKEMDQVMITSFKDTFETIRNHFKETFRELFKGGNADLKLTDPNNLLETGIEIVASPPGKSLRSISLLSGGEMTFTAISLLFAILKTRPVPFCILDEVEAALDEVNVDSFGEYLSKFKEKTQFILITHKKKTMEYADVLYGITMQESGVSKLVSVRLEEIK
ncbi:MAG: AAA family ATPase [Tenericutes bacterium]|nr:AAA family ATPase [Mycoplasmatota bacterium]